MFAYVFSWGAGRRSGSLDEDYLACLLGIPPVRRIVMLPMTTQKEVSGSHVYHSAVCRVAISNRPLGHFQCARRAMSFCLGEMESYDEGDLCMGHGFLHRRHPSWGSCCCSSLSLLLFADRLCLIPFSLHRVYRYHC